VIAADGGAATALALGLRADEVIGDLDSVSPGDEARVRRAGGRVHRHPRDKDATDLELALAAAVSREPPRPGLVQARLGPAKITVIRGSAGLTAGRPAHGVTTSGLRYPLDGHDLKARCPARIPGGRLPRRDARGHHLPAARERTDPHQRPRRMGLLGRRRGMGGHADHQVPAHPVNNRLRELRAIRRWRPADLANRLDVSRQTINAVEAGRYDLSLPLAFKLAAVFELPIESIFSPETDTAARHPAV
jgi:putative transcriptional regulator